MRQKCIVLLLGVLACGCVNLITDSTERFSDKYYVLEERDATNLDGPYKMKGIISPNAILGKKGQKQVRILFRGCLSTDDVNLDMRARKLLGGTWPGGAYLDSGFVWMSSSDVKAVVYTPANRIWTGRDSNGKSTFRNLTYTMPQLLLFLEGVVLLDHSDTNYPLYQVFVEAENLAKKHRQGYWATHTEPPAQAPTNAISKGQ